MSHHLHMSNWMAVGDGQHKKSKENVRLPGSKIKVSKTDAYKTVMCQAWLESKMCVFAENCRFAHGEEELRPCKVAPKQNGKYKTKLCDKYTTSGLCPYGTRCLFIHPDNGPNAYIRPDKIAEVTHRHAMADMNAQKLILRPTTPEIPTAPSSSLFECTPLTSRSQANKEAPSSWPLERANFFSDKNDDGFVDHKLDIQNLFGCFDSSTTPNRVSIASGISGYMSGSASPFSSLSTSVANVSSDDEHFERDYFRITGLENLAEELTRNLTTTSDLW